MIKTAAQVTPAEMAVYLATARRRKAQEDQDVTCRRARAWALARRAATLLREQFGATRVVLFGSLVYEDGFTLWSADLCRNKVAW